MKVPGRILCFILSCFIFVFPDLAPAETMYVTDQLVITVRTGASNEHAIIKTVKSDTPLEVLEHAEGNKYAKVRLTSGEEGYALVRYLTNVTPKSQIISRLETEVEKLQNTLEDVENKRNQLTEGLENKQEETSSKSEELNSHASELESELLKTRQELQSLSETYATLLDKSDKIMEITSERDRLLENNRQLTAEVRLISEEKSSLMRSGMIKWFVAGGAVFFFGWLIGIISRKKKQGLTF
jgi:SH3 domain protein